MSEMSIKNLFTIIGNKCRDTGWQEITLPPDTTCQAYSVSPLPLPHYRRIGNVVYISGVLSPKQTYTGSVDLLLAFNLPNGYKPSLTDVVDLQQGSGTACFAWRVATTGVVTWERYRKGDGYASASDRTWLPINLSFVTDDAFPE